MWVYGLLSCCPFVLGLSSCDDEDKADTHKSLNDYVASLPSPSQDPVVEKTQLDTLLPIRNGNQICSSTTFKAGASFSEQMILNPTSDIIYVGCLLDGASVVSGEYLPLPIKRAPMRISTNFANKSGAVYADVKDVSLSTVRQAEKEMLNDSEINGATAATLTFEISEVESKEEVDLKVGVSAKFGSKASVSDNFEFNKNSYKSSILVKFNQVYYTVDMDFPSSPSDLFDKSVTAEDLKHGLTSGKMPCYVSSVKYGRVAYVAIETNEDSKTLQNDLKASISAWGSTMEASTSFEKKYSNKNTKIQGTIFGGNAGSAANAISGIDGIKNFILNGGNFGKENPASPIAYTLRRLSDNKIFAVNSNTEYVINNCVNYEGGIRLKSIQALTGENSGGDDLEPYGSVDVVVDGVTYPLFNLSRNQDLHIFKGQVYEVNGSGNNATINGKSCVAPACEKINLSNYRFFKLALSFKEADSSKDDVFYTYCDASTKTAKNYYQEWLNNSSIQDMADAFDNGETSYEIFVDLYRPYDNAEKSRNNKTHWNNPDKIRVTFEVTLQK